MSNINIPNLRGEISFNISLARYNTWGVGGIAQCVFHPADINDLSHMLANLEKPTSITWLGLGSNVLIRDGGIDGVVIVTQAGLKNITFSDHTVYAQAGVACAKLARQTVTHGHAGLEFLAGIPGTIGGALAMNAGAFGGQTWDYILEVDTINRAGEILTRKATDFEYGYRYVKTADDEWFVGAKFNLNVKENDTNVVSIKDLLAKRAASQPIGKKNCGSVFKNPAHGYAAEYIEQCGLKGYTIGGACVSNKHANFILNEDNATADDIEKLIIYIQNTVQQKCNVELVPEVRFLGKPT